MTISRIAVAALLCARLLASRPLEAQTGAPRTGEPFAFRHGQSVYVTAFHAIEHSARRAQPVAVTNAIDNHLPAEFRIRKDFEKRGAYRLVNKASEADFVFVVLIDDGAAEGLAVAPGVFAAFRQSPDMGALREAAHARSIIGPLKVHNLGRLSDHLVKRFHEQEGLPMKIRS